MDTLDRQYTKSCISIGREAPCKELERAVHIGEVTGPSPVKIAEKQAIVLEHAARLQATWRLDEARKHLPQNPEGDFCLNLLGVAHSMDSM